MAPEKRISKKAVKSDHKIQSKVVVKGEEQETRNDGSGSSSPIQSKVAVKGGERETRNNGSSSRKSSSSSSSSTSSTSSNSSSSGSSSSSSSGSSSSSSSSSSSNSSNSSSSGSSSSSSSSSSASNDQKPRSRDAPMLTAEGVNRNRRMFGVMMGHLGQAKRKAEEDDKTREKKRKIEAVKKTVNELEKQIDAIDTQREKWMETDIQPVMDFLATTGQPSLLWRPTQHNTQTSQLVAVRHESIEKQIEERLTTDARLKDKLQAEVETLREKTISSQMDA